MPGNLSSFPGKEYYQFNAFSDVSLPGENYIEKIAFSWCLAADKYIQNLSKMKLIRYEDFMVDKTNSIAILARQVDLNPANDITDYLDIQYQPRGDHSISWIDFFGEKNLKSIEEICREYMNHFGYS